MYVGLSQYAGFSTIQQYLKVNRRRVQLNTNAYSADFIICYSAVILNIDVLFLITKFDKKR